MRFSIVLNFSLHCLLVLRPPFLQKYRPQDLPSILQHQAVAAECAGSFSDALITYLEAANILSSSISTEEKPSPYHGVPSDFKYGSCRSADDELYSLPVSTWTKKQLLLCLRGAARCAFSIGEMQKGLQLTAEVAAAVKALTNDVVGCNRAEETAATAAVYRDFAQLLQRKQQFTYAAGLFAKAGDSEAAARLYLQVFGFSYNS